MQPTPIKVAVTGAAGMIGSMLCPMIAKGAMFGPNQPVILHLIELPVAEKPLRGLVMELEDGAYPLLAGIVATTDATIGFADIDVALLVGARPRGPGMERKDLLLANAAIFVAQGKILNEVAKKTVKVCVVGNPANTNCLIAQQNAPSIPARNFTALTRLDENRSKSIVANKCQVQVSGIQNIIIWGNHSGTMFPDIRKAQADGKDVSEMIQDEEWIRTSFVEQVQKRGAAIIEAKGISSVSSAANAICDHMHDWWHGTKSDHVSMGVISDGNTYGVPKDLIFSFPLAIEGGEWKIVEGIDNSQDHIKARLDATTKELLEERMIALNF